MKLLKQFKQYLVFVLTALVVLSIAVVSPWHKDTVKAAWYSDASWQYRQKIVIDHTKVASSDQTDFPVMVKITNQYNPIFSNAKDDGTDILLTSNDGSTKLSHEIDTFSKVNKELIIWVKIPTLSFTEDTSLYMYYGNSGASDQQNKTDVWSSGYIGVWHMSETSGTVYDSSASVNNSSAESLVYTEDGKLGRGVQGDFALSSAMSFSGDYTYDIWYQAPAFGNTYAIVSGEAGWNYNFYDSRLRAYFASSDRIIANTAATANVWQKWTVTRSGTSLKIYLNGQADSATGSYASAVSFNRIGGTSGTQPYMDEAHASTTVRSAGWIATEYNNQNDPGGFLTVYYERSQSDYDQVVEKDWLTSSFNRRQKIQVANNTASALTDYQILLDSSSVDLSSVFANAKSDGSDIRFGDNSSTSELDYYIQSYSQAQSSAKVWVKVPYIPASSSTYIYLYYNNPDASSASSLTNVNSSTETEITSGLTAAATSYFGSYSPALTIDGNLTTFWHGNNDGQLHSLWVSGISNKILSTVKVYHYAGQWASTFKIQGSNDSFSSDIREFASVTSPTQNMTFSNIDDSASAIRYLTLTTAQWYNPTIYEIEFYTKFKIASTEPTVTLSGGETLYDSAAPTNPSSFTAKNIEGGLVTLSAANYYNYTTPYFDWPAVDADGGASDDVSGVVGYYLYFGTSCGAEGANPALTRGLLSDLGSGLHLTTDTEISAQTLSNNGTYCLRMKTKDLAGNVSDTVEAFVYNFETTVPSAPTYIAANPAGYSSSNSFSFTWPATSDTGGSGLAGYQYKRGGDSGDDWSVTTEQTSVSAIQAYQTGENIFYVRAIDNAGNVSNEAQTNYYYASNAPVKPTELVASPDMSDVNSFSFNWTAPVHGIDIAEYGYSINATPTEQNIIWTGSDTTSLSAGAYATIQGVNTIYVVAKDSVDNYAFDQANYATATFTCQTSAPPTPIAISAVDSSDRAINRWMITVQWAAGSGQDATTFDHYLVERSTDGDVFSELATTTSTAYIDADLSNTTTYFYRIKAVDNADSQSVVSSTVSKIPTGNYPTPPTIVSDPVAEVKATSATVTWVTNRASTGAVKFGTSEDELDRSQLDAQEQTEHQITLPGLEPSTTYYFKVQSLDSARDYSENDAYSSIFTLKTLAAPGIQNVKITNISLNSADVSWETSSASTTLIRYGTTINYDKSWEDGSSYTTKHTFKFEDLDHTSTYHFKISGLDADENTINSDDYVFDTLPLPKISAVSFETDYNDAQPQTSISWTTNVATTSSVEYLPKGGGNVTYEESQSDLISAHKVKLTKLSDDTSYSFYVSGTDQFGNKVTSDEYIFNTPFDSRPARISDVQVEASNVGLDKQDKAQLIISWKTDEVATTQVEYGEGVSGAYTNKTSEDQTLTNDHFVIISDLEPSKPYHLRVISRDKGGNETLSEDINSIPGEVPRSLLKVLLSTFENIFGWVGKLI